jgi:hypothetical protein
MNKLTLCGSEGSDPSPLSVLLAERDSVRELAATSRSSIFVRRVASVLRVDAGLLRTARGVLGGWGSELDTAEGPGSSCEACSKC